jgi:U3 small nucleolar ribonucleoprotein component
MRSRRIKIKERVHLDKEINELNKNKFEEIMVTHKNFVEALRRISRSILDPELEFYHGYIG